MSRTELIRTVRFRAVHHYRLPEWSDRENRNAFGDTAEPHGHDWTVEVTVSGPADPRTGFVVDLPALDAALSEVVDPLREASLNEVVARFRDGHELPSTENLAAWLWDELRGRIPGEAHLRRVRVFEDASLGAAYEGGDDA